MRGRAPEANRPALHEDDRVVPVSTDRCRCEAEDKSGLHFLHDALERERGNMVAFIDDHLPVVRDDVSDGAFPHEALHDADVDRAGG